jgi:fermentation-respiration switch protein FrsA (DUF1100 family)
VRTDWRDDDQLDVLDPPAIRVPTLLIHGERDPLARVDFGTRLFSRLGAGQRQWTILAGCDHAAHVEKCHSQFVDAIDGFFARVTRSIEESREEDPAAWWTSDRSEIRTTTAQLGRNGRCSASSATQPPPTSVGRAT